MWERLRPEHFGPAWDFVDAFSGRGAVGSGRKPAPAVCGNSTRGPSLPVRHGRRWVGLRAMRRLVGNGSVERVARGLFRVAEAEQIEHCTVGAVCAGVPGVIVCLLSALSVHELTTKIVWQEWIAIEQKARTRRPRGLRVRVVRFSGTALRYGVVGGTWPASPAASRSAATPCAPRSRRRSATAGRRSRVGGRRRCWRATTTTTRPPPAGNAGAGCAGRSGPTSRGRIASSSKAARSGAVS